MRSVVVLMLIAGSLFADMEVTKTAFINASDSKGKGLQEIREILLMRVKRAAASEIFGDYINSSTVVKNGVLASDRVDAIVNGTIHLKGDPEFSNGKNFGDMQVRAVMYATQKEIDKAANALNHLKKESIARERSEQKKVAAKQKEKQASKKAKVEFDEPMPTNPKARSQVEKAGKAFDTLDSEFE